MTMITRHGPRSQRAFTLIELMIAIAVLGVLLTLAAPSFRDFMLTQRLKSVSAQLVTDLQFARSEAASRGQAVSVRTLPAVGGRPMSCYIFFTDTAKVPSNACDCREAEGSRCTASTAREIRSVILPSTLGVRLSTPVDQPDHVAFDPINGSIQTAVSNIAVGEPFVITAAIDGSRSLRTRISRAGRTSTCVPAGSTMSGSPC